MSAEKGLFWLASYPKSGNTWFRIFLANLLNTSQKPVDLNHINTGAIASSRGWIDEALGFEAAYLDHDELDQLRPAIYTWQSEQCTQVAYHKIHDAYTYVDNDRPMIPSTGCLGAIYFIRNPLDVAISFANHSNCSIDQAIANMADEKFAFCKGKYKQHNQLRQWLLSWSLHVQSWVTAQDINVLVLRYEDMKEHPLRTFTKAVEFLQLESSQVDITKALDNAHIEKLQQQEEALGFSEKPAKVARFFRKGIIGDWRNMLTPAQVKQIIYDHGDMMRQYGYLDMVI
jgi:aryl sulfotransferase